MKSCNRLSQERQRAMFARMNKGNKGMGKHRISPLSIDVLGRVRLSPRAVDVKERVLSDEDAWEVLTGMKGRYRGAGLSHTSFADDVRTTFKSNPELLGRVMQSKGFTSADSFYVSPRAVYPADWKLKHDVLEEKFGEDKAARDARARVLRKQGWVVTPGTFYFDGMGYRYSLEAVKAKAKEDKASPLMISSRFGGSSVPVDFAGEKPYYDEYAKRSPNVVPSKAFYDHDEHRIFVNDDAVDDVDSGKDEAYTLRHEYGHHILHTTNEGFADAYATYGDEFLRGIDIEKKAHKCDMDKAAEIALTHLKEDDNFYDKLIRVKL